MVDFAAGDEIFSFTNGNVYVKLGMAIIMELLIVVLYSVAGFRTAMANGVKSAESGFPWGKEQSVPLKSVSPDGLQTSKGVQFEFDPERPGP